jgi:glycosyltransferase involved in cell wall biosynthesis
MRKLYLIFHGRFPSEKAAALFAAKSCEAFAQQGFDVTLLVPRRKGVNKDDPFAFFNVKKSFRVTYLLTFDFFSFTKSLGFWISLVAFSFSVYFYLVKNGDSKNDIVFSNELLPLFFVSLNFKNTFYEMHDFPESKIFIFGTLLSHIKWVLIHNHWKLQETKKRFPKISSKKFLCEPNAVDISTFDINLSKDEARKMLNLPRSKKIVMYTGHLYGWKGTDTLAAAARLLSDEYLVVFVGGTQGDIERFKKLNENQTNILIVGFKPHGEMPVWQKAADVLVLPNTAKEKISAYYTSPMKLFEYMASSRPIVASDIPSINEVVDKKSAYLVTPDDAVSLARGIEEVIHNEGLFSKEAFKKVLNHSWEKRAMRIKEFMDL